MHVSELQSRNYNRFPKKKEEGGGGVFTDHIKHIVSDFVDSSCVIVQPIKFTNL